VGREARARDEHRVAFDWLGVATALVKAKGIHEGLWRIELAFDLRAASVRIGNDQQVPGAFLPVMAVHLHRVEVLDPLTVDAAVVNPEQRIIMPATLAIQ
jgi:hypothetical protein